MPNWNHVLHELNQTEFDLTQKHNKEGSAADQVRRKYLKEYAEYTDRNVVV